MSLARLAEEDFVDFPPGWGNRTLADRLRVAARRDAADFAWPIVIDGLLERLRFMCLHQRVVLPPGGAPSPA